MSTALYRKWRSQTFEEVVGQDHITQTLRNALREERVAHAYLFAGPRGTGKTSTARILAKAMNCTAPEEERPCNRCPTCIAITEGRMIDLIEIDAASNNSVDDIRELREKVGFRPSEGRYKIYIIDEVHMLSNSAFNALLKTLEEPPPHARFMLATTEPHKIPATVLSRCQRFDFRRIPVPAIAEHLTHIAAEEGYAAEPDALLAIARSAQGCMRDAVSLLDQLTSYSADRVTLAQVQQVLGAVNAEAVGELVDALAAQDVGRGLGLIHRLVTDGASLSEFCQQVVEHLRGVMLLQMTGDAELLDDLPRESIEQLQGQARRMDLPLTLHAVKQFSAAVPELKGGMQPQLPLELAFIESAQGPPLAQAVAVATEAPAQAMPAADAAQPKTRPAKGKTPAKTPAKQEPTAATVAPTMDMDAARRLWSNWREFLGLVKRACGQQVTAALQAVRDVAVGDDAVAFAFGNNEFSRNLATKPEVLPKLTAVLAEYLDRDVTLTCQMGDKAHLAGRPRPPLPAPRSGPDPLLEYAVSDLGAEVVDNP